MDLIWSPHHRKAFQNFLDYGFTYESLSDREVVFLTTMGMLNINTSTISDCIVEEVTNLSNCLTLCFDPVSVNPLTVIELMETTCKVFDDMIRYVEFYANEIVNNFDITFLLLYLKTNVIENNEFDTIIPLKTFFECVKQKLRNKSHKALQGIPSMISLIPKNKVQKFLDRMSDYQVVTALTHEPIDSKILKNLFLERGILPYNSGFLNEKCIDFISTVMVDFMLENEIDFSKYVSKETLSHPSIKNVIKRYLCPHVSKNAIRESLLYESTYDNLVKEIGIIVHASIGNKSEYSVYAYPNTQIKSLTGKELQVIMSNIYLYANELGLKECIYNHIKNNKFAWTKYADACLQVCDNKSEDEYLKAIKLSSTKIFTHFPFITSNTLKALLSKNFFDYSINDKVDFIELMYNLPHILKLQHVCLPEYVNLFRMNSVQDIYTQKFCKHPLYASMVINSELPHQTKVKMLQTVPHGTYPLEKVDFAIFSIAYKWIPSKRYNVYKTQVSETVKLHNVNVFKTNTYALSNGTYLQTGNMVLKKMQIFGSVKNLKSFGETNHKLVYVTSKNQIALGITYDFYNNGSTNFVDKILLIAEDLLNLLKEGIIVNVFSSPFKNSIFDWNNYETLDDKLIRFSKLFKKCNHYLARAYIYAKTIYQYLIYCINFWVYHVIDCSPAEFLIKLVEIYVPVNELYMNNFSDVCDELVALRDNDKTSIIMIEAFLKDAVATTLLTKVSNFK